MIGTAMYPDSHSIAAIRTRLCSTGVTAGRAKRWKLLSTPPARATIEMKPR